MPYYRDPRTERATFIDQKDLDAMSEEDRAALLNLHDYGAPAAKKKAPRKRAAAKKAPAAKKAKK